MTKRTPAERAKFQFEFMVLMLTSGRDEMAQEAAKKGFAALDEIIEGERE